MRSSTRSRNRNRRPSGSGRRTLLGATICLGFLLQHVVLPVHLTLEDHNHPGAPSQEAETPVWTAAISGHAHAAAHAHRHAHRHAGGSAQAESEAPEPGHEPHPVTDHLDPFAGPPLPKHTLQLLLAPVPLHPVLPVLDVACARRNRDEANGPRPPPPRGRPEPRAPPAAT